MFDAYLYSNNPLTPDDMKNSILRAVCRDEDDETSDALVLALVRAFRALEELVYDGGDYVDEAWQGIDTPQEGYTLYYEAYFQEYAGRSPKDDDYGDLMPPSHVQFVGVPREAIRVAARADAQRTKALMRYIADNRKELLPEGATS
jgi:hypothetical protein